MAKDFVTPEQYQRGVGKIKNYVDNLSVIAPLDNTSNNEYVKVNLEDLELTKTYIVPKGRYVGILVTKKDGTTQSVLVVSNTCFSIYVITGNKGTANRIFYYNTNFGSYKVNVTSDVDNKGNYIIKKEAFVLGADNLIEYNPQTPYSPTTKKYVDDKVVGLATETYVDDKTSMENVIYEGNGTGPDVISDYWTGCPVSKGNGCWVINKQIEFDSSKPNPYYLLCDSTLYSPENSTFDKTNSAWIYPKVPNTGTIFICNKYNGENKLVLPWDDVNTPGKIKLYTKTELAKAMFSGDYNDLSNKPNIPSIEGLATEEYVNNKVTDTATSLTNDPDIYLTKDKYQYVTGVNTADNIIWLPSTDLPAFLKMHLYVTNCKMQSVFDAAIKWKINQNPNEGKFKIVTDNVYEFILTYINGSWIGEVVTYSNAEYIPTNDADVTTKKYVDNLTVQATSEEVKNMLNTTLRGDYSGEKN